MKRTKLVEARKAQNLSMNQLAVIIGVSKATISFIENCKCDPSWEVAQRLEQYFSIPASELLEVKPDEPQSLAR